MSTAILHLLNGLITQPNVFFDTTTFVHYNMRVEIGLFLRERRKERGISQAHLARKLGLTRSAINKIELGRSKGSLDTVVGLVALLGIDPGAPELEALGGIGALVDTHAPACERTMAARDAWGAWAHEALAQLAEARGLRGHNPDVQAAPPVQAAAAPPLPSVEALAADGDMCQQDEVTTEKYGTVEGVILLFKDSNSVVMKPPEEALRLLEALLSPQDPP